MNGCVTDCSGQGWQWVIYPSLGWGRGEHVKCRTTSERRFETQVRLWWHHQHQLPTLSHEPDQYPVSDICRNCLKHTPAHPVFAPASYPTASVKVEAPLQCLVVIFALTTRPIVRIANYGTPACRPGDTTWSWVQYPNRAGQKSNVDLGPRSTQLNMGTREKCSGKVDVAGVKLTTLPTERRFIFKILVASTTCSIRLWQGIRKAINKGKNTTEAHAVDNCCSA